MWVTWRRLRSVVTASALVVAVLMIVAVGIGRRAQRLATEYYNAPCNAGMFAPGHDRSCTAIELQFFHLRSLQGTFILVLVALVLITASVIGAVTIAAEFDRGTVNWAWTQSRPRRRWWAESTFVALASTAVLTLPLAVTMSWWIGASRYDSRFGALSFLVGGWLLVPVAVFATAVTLLAGLVVRRPGWLVAVGVVVALAGFYYVHHDERIHLVPIRTAVIGSRLVHGQYVDVNNPSFNADILWNGYRHLGDSGVPTSDQEQAIMRAFNACENAVAATMVKGPNPAANQTGADVVYAVNDCQRKLGVDLVDLYISESEYWTLQDREGALFLGAGAFLWFAGWWWVRRARA